MSGQGPGHVNQYHGKPERKKGPGPAYIVQPAIPSSPHYPIRQGPPVAPMGAPPSFHPPPLHGHPALPHQPYFPGGSVPQFNPNPGQPPYVYVPPVAQPYPVQHGQVPTINTGPSVFVPNAFDAGARFDAMRPPTIPPPPPGVAPNAAQMAAMQGYTVTGTQQKSNFWTDGTGSGGVKFF